MRAPWPRALLALLIALGLSACGSGNDPSEEPPTTSPPEPAETRPASAAERDFPAEFTKKVDPVCVQAEKEVDKLAGTEIKDRATLRKAAAAYEDAAVELEKLEPPAQNATAYKLFTDAFRHGSDLLAQLDAEVGRGDNSAYDRVPGILDQSATQVKDLATQYGFKQCAAG